MFFALSKILGAVLAPLNLVMVLAAAGILLRPWAQRLSSCFLVAGAAIFIIAGFFPIGHNVLVLLEGRIVRTADMPGDLDGLLVLGGSVDTVVGAARGQPTLNASAERIIAGIQLARRYPEAVLTYSGGTNVMGDAPHNTEAVYIQELIAAIGGDPRPVFFEDESRSTYENISKTMRLLQPQPDETWVLVTSAWHMPRAAAVMQSIGWPGRVLYWPVDYRTDGRIVWWPDKLDVAGNMDKAALALHETVGWLTYRLTGRINPRGEGIDNEV